MTQPAVLALAVIAAVFVLGIWHCVVCIPRVRNLPRTADEWVERAKSEGWTREQTLKQWAKRQGAVLHLWRAGPVLVFNVLLVMFFFLFGPNAFETFPQIIPPWEWLW